MKRSTENLRHTRWECKYHVVFIPKYRKKSIYGVGRKELEPILSPKLVFPEGWNFAWVKPTEIDGIDKIKANWMLTRKGSSQRLVLYWYQDSEMTFGSEFNYRMKLFERQILGGRTDGAVVSVVTPIRDYEDVEQAQDRLKSLALHLYPRLVQLVAY